MTSRQVSDEHTDEYTCTIFLFRRLFPHLVKYAYVQYMYMYILYMFTVRFRVVGITREQQAVNGQVTVFLRVSEQTQTAACTRVVTYVTSL